MSGNEEAGRIAADVLQGLDRDSLTQILSACGATNGRWSRLGLIAQRTNEVSHLGEATCPPAPVAAAMALFRGEAEAWKQMPAQALLALKLGRHAVLICLGEAIEAFAVALDYRSDLAGLRALQAAWHSLPAGSERVQSMLEQPGVLRAWRLDAADGRVLEAIGQPLHAKRSPLGRLEAQSQWGTLVAAVLGRLAPLPGQLHEVEAILLDGGESFCELRRLDFFPDLLVSLESQCAAEGHRVWITLREVALDVLRLLIGRFMAAGLETMIQPFPKTDVEFEQILKQLRELAPDDLQQRLVIGGFADHPVPGPDGPMRCAECIYFLPRRRWCDLPELPLPVDGEWYCRLWKL